jgi:hypothetical protein
MSASLLNAGRTTHLKIVAVALMAGIAVVGVGINARITNIATDRVGADAVRQGWSACDLRGSGDCHGSLSAGGSWATVIANSAPRRRAAAVLVSHSAAIQLTERSLPNRTPT